MGGFFMNILGTLTDAELMNLTLKKMEKLRMFSNSNDMNNIRKTKSQLHILFKEVKRRNIKADEKVVASKLLKEY